MIIGYGRVSSREQEGDGSLEQQKDRLRKAGAEDIWVDVESGTKDKRVAYQRLQEKALELGEGLTIIVTRLDRLTRSLVELRKFIELIEKTGAKLIALDDHLDLTTSVGRFQLNMLGALAEMESDRMGERIRHGHAFRRSQGKPSPGFALFGYKRGSDEGGDRLVPDKEKVICFEEKEWSRWDLARLRIELIKETGSLYSASRQYNRRIGLDLIVKGHPFGKLRTSPPGMSNWVSNPTLRGSLVYGRVRGDYQEQPGKIEPLMTQQEWDEIELILSFNNKKRGGSGVSQLLFAGLVRCSVCGGAFSGRRWGTKSGESRAYHCRRRANYGGCPSVSSIDEKTLLSKVGRQLTKKANEIWSTEAVSLPSTQADPDQIKLREQIKTLKKMDYNPVIEKAIADLENSLIAMVSKKTMEDDSVRARREEIKEVFADRKFWKWLEGRPDDMRRTLKRYVKAVWVRDGKIERIEFSI
jgi:DNA invertase Pin-like site-specific DNA recombinase